MASGNYMRICQMTILNGSSVPTIAHNISIVNMYAKFLALSYIFCRYCFSFQGGATRSIKIFGNHCK